jgi:predicted RNase H-like HicB family nuclease
MTFVVIENAAKMGPSWRSAPPCWTVSSRGTTREEALANIRDTIQGVIEVIGGLCPRSRRH